MSLDGSESLAVGFVMEQVLGHRTHYQNLRRFVERDAQVAPHWMPIEFAPSDRVSRLPGVRDNWSARASWLGWDAVRRTRAAYPLDAVFYHSQVTALLSPFQRGVPTIISLDATPLNYDSVGAQYGHDSGGRLERIKFRANRHALLHAGAVVTWCKWAKDSLVGDYGIPAERISVIAPGVDLTRWPQRDEAAAVSSVSPRLPRLLFVGGDFARKGGETLLVAFSRALAERCELSIVTQTPIEPRPHLHVYNQLTPNSDTLLRLYAEADIFVFPSLADCAPLAVPEAMAASLPVIATRVGAIPEMVREGETGLLIAPGDAGALAAAALRLLDAPELRARLGRSGRALVEREYDAERNARRLVEVIRDAVEGYRVQRQPASRRLHPLTASPCEARGN